MTESSEDPEVPPHLRAELARALHGLGAAGEHPRDGPETGASGQSRSSTLQGAQTLAPGTELDRFMVLRRVGGGGQGDVYAAYDPRLDRRVALKLIRLGNRAGDEMQNARLLREAQALARLEHPNVIRVHDTGSDGAAAFLVMEFKRSPTLTRWLEDGSRRWREIVEKFHAAGRGLRAAHVRGIVHRDVKADNIFVDEHVGAVLGDFGLALGVGEGVSHSDPAMRVAGPRASSLRRPLTAKDQFPGTEGYVAPEAMRGQATALSDQYSFCVALFHALFGLMARPDEDRWPTRPRDRVPRSVIKVLHRGLSRDPTARFPDMGALLAALPGNPARGVGFIAMMGLVTFVAGAAFAIWGRSDLCLTAAKDELAQVWDDKRRGVVMAGFESVDVPYAKTIGASFLRFVDTYAGQWIEERAGACASSSPSIEHCLERRLRNLDGLAEEFVSPTENLVEHAFDMVDRLDAPSSCRTAPGGGDDLLSEDVQRLFDAAEWRVARGDFAAARDLIDALKVSEREAPAARARVLYIEGWMSASSVPDRRSDQQLDAAMWAAAKILDADTYSRAATYRLHTLAYDLGDFERAMALERYIESVTAWWSPDTPALWRFKADYAEARGTRRELTGDWQGSVVDRFIVLLLRFIRHGADHPIVAKAHQNLAATLADAHAEFWDDAHHHFFEAYRIAREQLGLNHPQTLDAEYGILQYECEDLAVLTDDPSMAEQCMADFQGMLGRYRAQGAYSPRILRRQALTLANQSILAGCVKCAEDAIQIATSAVDDAQVDVREKIDLYMIRAQLANSKGFFVQAYRGFWAGVEKIEADGIEDGNYFDLLSEACRAMDKEGRGDLAVAALMQRRIRFSAAACDQRLGFAGVIEVLAGLLLTVPDRNLDELRVSAAQIHRECP